MSKRGSPYLRWALWIAADRARLYDPAMRAYYARKRSEGKCHKVAMSAVVRKLVSVIYAVMRDGAAYVCPATKGGATSRHRLGRPSAACFRMPENNVPYPVVKVLENSKSIGLTC